MRGFLFSALLVACGSSDNSSSSNGGATNGDGGGPSVTGNPNIILSLTVPPQTFVVQGADVKIPVDITRDPTLHGPVHIAAMSTPAGYTIDPLDLPEGTTHADLRVAAATATTQGPLDVSLQAAIDKTAVQSKLSLFTRGPAGSLDTTFDVNALANVQPRFAMQLATGPKGIYAAVSAVGGVVTLVRTDPDGKQLKKNDLGVGLFIALVASGGFYNAGTTLAGGALNRLARFTDDLDIDTTFNGGPKSVNFDSSESPRSIGLRAVGDSAVLLTGHQTGGNPETFYVSKWSSNGTLDSSYGNSGRCNLTLTTGGALGITGGPSDSTIVFAQADTAQPLKTFGCTSAGQRFTGLGASTDYVRDSPTSVRFASNAFVPDGAGGYFAISQEQTGSPAALHLQHVTPGGTISDTGASVSDPSNGLAYVVDSKNRLLTATGGAGTLTVRRYGSDGSADSAFVAPADSGKGLPPGTAGVGAQAIVMQGTDRFIIAGRILPATPFILRYWN